MVSAVLGRHGGVRMKRTEQAGQGGLKRCEWALGDPALLEYHDVEWGVPEHDDRKLFEFLVLEGVQAGLSWLTVLKKRENYRRAFDGFDPEMMSKSALDWLLQEDQPSVRYLTLTQLLERPLDDPEVVAAKDMITRKGWAQEILAKQDPAGWWESGESLYRRKYLSSNWMLLILADLGLT